MQLNGQNKKDLEVLLGMVGQQKRHQKLLPSRFEMDLTLLS